MKTTNDSCSAVSGACFGLDVSEFNVFYTDRQLAAIQTAAKMLESFAEEGDDCLCQRNHFERTG